MTSTYWKKRTKYPRENEDPKEESVTEDSGQDFITENLKENTMPKDTYDYPTISKKVKMRGLEKANKRVGTIM